MQGLLSFLFYLPFIALVIIANLAGRHSWARYATYTLLILTDLALLFGAAAALFLRVFEMVQPEALSWGALSPDWLGVAAVCFAAAVLAALILLAAVRRWIARFLPIDPDSMVHMTALAFVVYQVGASLQQMAFLGELASRAEIDVSLTVVDVLFSGLPLLLLALFGVGLFVRRTGPEVLGRLGLRMPTWKHLVLSAVLVGLLLALDYGVNLAWEALDPAGYNALAEVTDQLFGGLMSIGGAIVLGLSAGISEELLFRGALQPRLGLVLASCLFGIGHLQYGFSVAMLEVLVIGLVLGVVRNRANTTTAILVHAGYNAAAVLLGLLKP